MTTLLINLVANVAKRVLQENPLRLTFTVKNDSATDVYLGEDQSLATSGFKQGFLIPSGGDSAFDEHHKGEVWLISTGNINVTVEERLPTIKKLIELAKDVPVK